MAQSVIFTLKKIIIMLIFVYIFKFEYKNEDQKLYIRPQPIRY
jgi:hypothetical protein